MKQLIGLFFCLMSLVAFAQTPHYQRVGNYQEALDRGKMFAARSQYDSAVSYYNAALAFEPDKKEVIDGLIKEAFENIQKTVQQEQAQKTKLVLQQEKLRLETQKALENEKIALENQKNAQIAQEKAEMAQKETQKAEKAVVVEKGNAIRTLYYFNALDFAKYTGMVADRTLKRQMALTAFLLLDSATEVVGSGGIPLEVLKAMTEAQRGISLEREGENTRITWANDSTFYFINHYNQSHLYQVKLQTSSKTKTIRAVMVADSNFSKQPVSRNYIEKMAFGADKSLFLEDDLLKKYSWKSEKLIETQEFGKDSIGEKSEFRTDFSGKIFKNNRELSLSHKGMISQTCLSDQYFVSAGFDGKLILYRLKDDKSIVLYYNDSRIYSVQFSPNGKYLVFGDQKRVKIIFLDTDYLEQELRRAPDLSLKNWQTYKNDNNLLKQPTWKK